MSIPSWCVLVCTLPLLACNASEAPLVQEQPDAGTSSTVKCPQTVQQVCARDVCTVHGGKFPASLASWRNSCGASTNPGVRMSGAPVSACGGWTWVSVPNGDQSIELFYDASGDIAAIMDWESAPPCLGACERRCVAGPATLDATQLASCTTNSSLGVCAMDAGAS